VLAATSRGLLLVTVPIMIEPQFPRVPHPTLRRTLLTTVTRTRYRCVSPSVPSACTHTPCNRASWASLGDHHLPSPLCPHVAGQERPSSFPPLPSPPLHPDVIAIESQTRSTSFPSPRLLTPRPHLRSQVQETNNTVHGARLSTAAPVKHMQVGL
jgi:hypothetical protein